MATENQQAQAETETVPQAKKEPEKEPIKSLKEGYQKAGKLFEEIELGKSEKAKEVTEPPEEECTTCDKKKGKPFRVLKIQGKEYPFYTQKEYDDAASQGIDYTKKRQADADDRRKWESEFQAKSDALTENAKKLNELVDRLKSEGAIKPQETGKETPRPEDELPPISKIYERLNLPEQEASDLERGVVEELYAEKTARHEQSKVVKQLANVVTLLLTQEQFHQMKRGVEEAKKKYPVKDILDEEGKSITWKQFEGLMKAKNADEVERQKPIGQLIEDCFREIYTMQEAAKGEASAEVGINPKMSGEEFKEKYPEIYAEIAKEVAAKAKAEYAQTMSDVPPSIGTGGTGKSEIDLRKKPKPPEPGKKKRFKDYLDEGLSDPEVQKMFGG